MIDITSIVGVFVAFGALIAGILIEGGNLMSYVGLSAAIIIFGGTIGATMISFPLSSLRAAETPGQGSVGSVSSRGHAFARRVKV